MSQDVWSRRSFVKAGGGIQLMNSGLAELIAAPHSIIGGEPVRSAAAHAVTTILPTC